MCQRINSSARWLADEIGRSWSVNDILRQFGPAYLKKFGDRMSLDQIKALRALSACRTAESGSILFYCQHCNKLHHRPKACGSRHCPSCQGDKARNWLRQQQARLLPCAYFMLTFTVPEEFRSFIRSHPRHCYRALMQAAYQSLTTLAKDPKYVGSDKLGATAVLHTWGRDLNYHPHVHMIVPGGAISACGTQWLASRADFLVSVLALSKIFRAKFKQLMQQCGLLKQIDPGVWHSGWNVNCQAVGDGRDSLRYLAPYVFRVAIGNHRIRRVEINEDGSGWVTFLVKPSGTRSYRPMRVTAEEFIRRFLQHVLPRGFQKVRHFGFMHHRSKVPSNWLNMLVTVTLNMVYTLDVGLQAGLPTTPPSPCPDCGGQLECLGFGQQALLKLRRLISFRSIVSSPAAIDSS